MILSHTNSTHLQWAGSLYTGIEDEAKVLLSTRLMLLTAIAETSLHIHVRDRLIATLSSLQKSEQDYHINNGDKFGTTLTKELTSYDKIRSILTIPDDFNGQETNEHHIIPRNGYQGVEVFNGKLSYAKAMKYGATKFKTIFRFYDLFVRNTHKKYFNGLIKGSDDEKNIKLMTIDRHNNGLNIRYPGNAFFQLQILLERYAEQRDYRNELKQEFPEVDEIERILNLHFSELHHPDCYIVKENKRK